MTRSAAPSRPPASASPTSQSVALLWVPRFWPAIGGTELHTHALAMQLAPRFGVEVITHCDVTASAHRTLAEEVCLTRDATLDTPGPTIHRLGLAEVRSSLPRRLAGHYDRSPLARAAFSHLLARHLEPAALQVARRARLVHFVYNGLTDAAMLARRVAHRQRLPFVFTPNVCDTSGAPSAWNSRRFRGLYRSATRLIALTEHEAEWLVRHGADPRAIRVVPYGPILEADADGRRARAALGIGEAPLLLFLGRIVDIKGYDLLLGACARVWSRFPDTRVLFMGPATPASRAAIRAMADPRLLLVEDADQRLKSDALAACDLLCLPSRAESLGVAYIEAAFNARAVVALDLPVLRHVVTHERHGLKVPESAAAVAEAICLLLAEPERRRRLGEQACRDAHARYAWPAIRDSIAGVYAEAIEAMPR